MRPFHCSVHWHDVVLCLDFLQCRQFDEQKTQSVMATKVTVQQNAQGQNLCADGVPDNALDCLTPIAEPCAVPFQQCVLFPY